MITPVLKTLRESSDPLTMWNNEEFTDRFRFSKWTDIASYEQLASEVVSPVNNHGLPIPPMMQLHALVTLRI